MNIVFVNLDFATDDVLRDVAGVLRLDEVHAYTYHEKEANMLSLGTAGSIIQSAEDCSGSRFATLVAIAPGFMTLKLLHDVAMKNFEKGEPFIHMGINLPEYWMMKKLESIDPFRFEAFYTYLSSCLSIGYPSMAMTCVSEPCVDYYAQAMLGGYRPPVRDIQDLCEGLGIVKHSPLGLG